MGRQGRLQLVIADSVAAVKIMVPSGSGGAYFCNGTNPYIIGQLVEVAVGKGVISDGVREGSNVQRAEEFPKRLSGRATPVHITSHITWHLHNQNGWPHAPRQVAFLISLRDDVSNYLIPDGCCLQLYPSSLKSPAAT